MSVAESFAQPSGVIHKARAEDVYPLIEPGIVELVHSDGPYAMQKAAWDRMKMADLPDWYAPHIEAWGRLCKPSASVYLWNTAEGWAAVHPVMLRAGWTFRALITWDKGLSAMAGKVDTEGMRTWYDVTEVCGFYQREPVEVNIWNEWGDAHPVRRYFDDARIAAGLSYDDIDRHLGTSDMGRHYFSWSQWCLPGADRYVKLQEILPSLNRPIEELREEHRRLWSEFRKKWDLIRAPFTLPTGVTNVWSAPQVGGAERLKGRDGQVLHPCQKPLAFADRIIRASSRSGSLVLEPFGGTCRIAVACEQIARFKPADARRYICVEMDEDGRDYVPAVLRQIDAMQSRPTLMQAEIPKAPREQVGLFTGAHT